MRIPSGDLAPARRRRRPGRRGRALPVLLVLLLLGAAGGGVTLLRRGDGDPGERSPAGACPTPVALQPVALQRVVRTQAALPAPVAVRLRVLNGTARDGLGRTVGDALAARGFVVLGSANASGPLAGRSQVRFGPGARPGATVLSAHVSGSVLVPVPAAPRGAVDLVLGGAFVRLRTPAETSAALRPAAPVAPRPAAPVPSRAGAPC